MLNNKYHTQIVLLDAMIANWHNLSKERVFLGQINEVHISKAFSVALAQGLCYNAKLHDIEIDVLSDMFSEWPEFSGSVLYPIEGSSQDFSNTVNMFKVERLRLAKHCRQYLFAHGAIKPTLAEKLDDKLNNNFIGGGIAFIIFASFIYYLLTSI